MSIIDDLLGKSFKVLDKGFIRIIDYMGNDSSIVQAARVSYGEGTKHVNHDRALINYLMRNNHTSPFEMCEIKLHIKLPIFVARQWIRHRTSSVNEYSARYSILSKDYYLPNLDDICVQSEVNKQGRGSKVDEQVSLDFLKDLKEHSELMYSLYEKYLKLDVAREIVRSILPINFYTEWYWKVNLHNLFHFLKLRVDSHAQYEIRQYANIILEKIVKEWVPISYNSFKEYKLNSNNFSKTSSDIIKNIINGLSINDKKSSLGKRE